ncbi:hypothetical protein [Desulfosporosinus sp. Sb-LF]|nr:hypothetical protein [Desulfosporosinus sp. Sb-LF]
MFGFGLIPFALGFGLGTLASPRYIPTGYPYPAPYPYPYRTWY